MAKNEEIIGPDNYMGNSAVVKILHWSVPFIGQTLTSKM
jgi:hypothetical protein